MDDAETMLVIQFRYMRGICFGAVLVVLLFDKNVHTPNTLHYYHHLDHQYPTIGMNDPHNPSMLLLVSSALRVDRVRAGRILPRPCVVFAKLSILRVPCETQ